jgi:RimJ/RimL family protein N-acetyltransferase
VRGGKVLVLEIINAKEIHVSDDEVRQIVQIESHPAVRRWLTILVDDESDVEFKGYRRFFYGLRENGDAEVLIARLDGQVVGFLVLWRLEEYMGHVASVGISVHPDSWGRGVATRLISAAVELAEEKGFKRLEIETLAENVGMRRAAEKLGFKYEGLRAKRIWKDGAYHDEVLYCLLL